MSRSASEEGVFFKSRRVHDQLSSILKRALAQDAQLFVDTRVGPVFRRSTHAGRRRLCVSTTTFRSFESTASTSGSLRRDIWLACGMSSRSVDGLRTISLGCARKLAFAGQRLSQEPNSDRTRHRPRSNARIVVLCFMRTQAVRSQHPAPLHPRRPGEQGRGDRGHCSKLSMVFGGPGVRLMPCCMQGLLKSAFKALSGSCGLQHHRGRHTLTR